MNERLKFSWSHIFSFIGIIVASYVAFVGFTYLTDGDFILAISLMVAMDLLFILFFIGAQQMKASGVHIRRKIVFERIFFFGAPIIFVTGMIGMSHFWTVQDQSKTVVDTFTSSIQNAKVLFDDYENYSNQRIDDYTEHLNQIIANKDKDKATFTKAGFQPENPNMQRDNMVEILQLQLMSDNFTNLKDNAIAWIDKSNKGAAVWNVFILGNTRQIKEAITNWENQLGELAKTKMTNEELLDTVPEFKSEGARLAIEGIDSLTKTFTSQKIPNWKALLFGLVLYLFLIFPYLLQDRHTKSWYTLLGKNKKTARALLPAKNKKNDNKNSDKDNSDVNINNTNGYQSF